MKIDYIEIGTSDFNTLISDEKNGIGISIEPIKYYLDKLPNRKNCIKIHKAISNKCGTTSIYFIKEENILKYNLPLWVKGCSSIDKKHPTIVKLLKDFSLPETLIENEQVYVTTLVNIIKEYNIESFNTLKIDTEGHDCIILKHFWDTKIYPKNIIFEYNNLTDQEELKEILSLYGEKYKIKNIGNDNIYLVMKQKQKIAIFIEKEWAFGRIHTDLIECLSDIYDFTWFDWRDKLQIQLFFKEWTKYNIIISNTILVSDYLIWNSSLSNNPEFLKKLCIIVHAPSFDNERYKERIFTKNMDFLLYPTYAAVSLEIVEKLKNIYGINAWYTPCGVNICNFQLRRDINFPLKRAGFVSREHPYLEPHKTSVINQNIVKRPNMFKNICEQTGLEPVYLNGMNFLEYSELYKNIDILICTSVFEGNPLSIFEASSCGITVISTKVGNTNRLKNIKTFEQLNKPLILLLCFKKMLSLHINIQIH